MCLCIAVVNRAEHPALSLVQQEAMALEAVC